MNDDSIATEEEYFGVSMATTTPTTTTTTTARPPFPPTTTTTTTLATTTTTTLPPTIFCGNPVTCSNVSSGICSMFSNWDATGVNGNLLTNCRLYGKMCYWKIDSDRSQMDIGLFYNTTFTGLYKSLVFAPDRTQITYSYEDVPATLTFLPRISGGMTGTITVDWNGEYRSSGCFYFNLQLTTL